ncbi:unnamed protein product, partial [Protopolystoma xenopodis]
MTKSTLDSQKLSHIQNDILHLKQCKIDLTQLTCLLFSGIQEDISRLVVCTTGIFLNAQPKKTSLAGTQTEFIDNSVNADSHVETTNLLSPAFSCKGQLDSLQLSLTHEESVKAGSIDRVFANQTFDIAQLATRLYEAQTERAELKMRSQALAYELACSQEASQHLEAAQAQLTAQVDELSSKLAHAHDERSLLVERLANLQAMVAMAGYPTDSRGGGASIDSGALELEEQLESVSQRGDYSADLGSLSHQILAQRENDLRNLDVDGDRESSSMGPPTPSLVGGIRSSLVSIRRRTVSLVQLLALFSYGCGRGSKLPSISAEELEAMRREADLLMNEVNWLHLHDSDITGQMEMTMHGLADELHAVQQANIGLRIERDRLTKQLLHSAEGLPSDHSEVYLHDIVDKFQATQQANLELQYERGQLTEEICQPSTETTAAVTATLIRYCDASVQATFDEGQTTLECKLRKELEDKVCEHVQLVRAYSELEASLACESLAKEDLIAQLRLAEEELSGLRVSFERYSRLSELLDHCVAKCSCLEAELSAINLDRPNIIFEDQLGMSEHAFHFSDNLNIDKALPDVESEFQGSTLHAESHNIIHQNVVDDNKDSTDWPVLINSKPFTLQDESAILRKSITSLETELSLAKSAYLELNEELLLTKASLNSMTMQHERFTELEKLGQFCSIKCSKLESELKSHPDTETVETQTYPENFSNEVENTVNGRAVFLNKAELENKVRKIACELMATKELLKIQAASYDERITSLIQKNSSLARSKAFSEESRSSWLKQGFDLRSESEIKRRSNEIDFDLTFNEDKTASNEEINVGEKMLKQANNQTRKNKEEHKLRGHIKDEEKNVCEKCGWAQ